MSCPHCDYDEDEAKKKDLLILEIFNLIKMNLSAGILASHDLDRKIREFRNTIYTFDHKGPYREDWAAWVKINTQGWFENDSFYGKRYCFPTVQELTAFQNIVRNSKEHP